MLLELLVLLLDAELLRDFDGEGLAARLLLPLDERALLGEGVEDLARGVDRLLEALLLEG